MASFCFNCMHELPDNENERKSCPLCGYENEKYVAEPHYLVPGTIVNNRYVIGRVIGEGGFGITYVGKDSILDLKVAIKEFYMSGYVNRNNTASTCISMGSGTYQETFERNREKFINEARVLAKFADLDGIVGIRDYFKENNTAYIVMDFLDGLTLREYLEEKGKLSWDETYAIMKPVLASLNAVHKNNVIHRDISPDNIKITPDGKVKLLDFGAAREVSQKDIKSLSVILKPGYAPEEQYRSKGVQGPWTDIYALCATMYKCMTGNTPDDAMERMFNDDTVPAVDAGSDCSPAISRVLEKGLAVRQKDRYRDIDELTADIEYAEKHPEETDFVKTDSKAGMPVVPSGDRTVIADEFATVDSEEMVRNGHSEEKEEIKTEKTKRVSEKTKKVSGEKDNKKEEKKEKRKSQKKKTAVFVMLGIIAAAAVILLISKLAGSPKTGTNVVSGNSTSGVSSSEQGIPEILRSMSITINGTAITLPTTIDEMEKLGWVAIDQDELESTVEPGKKWGNVELTNGYGKISVYCTNPTGSTLLVKQSPITVIYFSYYFLENYMNEEHNSLELPGGIIFGKATRNEVLEKYGKGNWKSTSSNGICYTSADETKEYEFNFDSEKVVRSLTIKNMDCSDVIALDTYSEYEPEYVKEDLDKATGSLEFILGEESDPILKISGCMLLSELLEEGWTMEKGPESINSHDSGTVYLRKDTLTTLVLNIYNPTNVARVTKYCYITSLKNYHGISDGLIVEGMTDIPYKITIDGLSADCNTSAEDFDSIFGQNGWEINDVYYKKNGIVMQKPSNNNINIDISEAAKNYFDGDSQ